MTTEQHSELILLCAGREEKTMRWLRFFVGASLGFLLAMTSGVVTAVDFTDDFAGGVDPFYWTIESNQALFTMDDTAGRLCFSKPTGGSGNEYDYIQVSFSCEVIGDFDVSIEFSDGFFDYVNGLYGNAAGLEARFGPQHLILSRGDDPVNGEHVHVWLAPQFQLVGVYPTTDMLGMLRLNRSGETVSAYFNDVLIHQEDFNNEQLGAVTLSLANNSTTDAIEVCFDNFSVIADGIYCNDLSQGMVAHYPFAGSAADASGNGNNGIVNGPTLVPDRWNNPDSAYLFDGIDDHIRVPRSGTLDIDGPLSMTAWIRGFSFTHHIGTAVVEKENASQGYNLHVRDDGRLHTRVDGTNFDAGLVYADQWHFLAAVYDGMFVRSYIDGAEVGEAIEWPPTQAPAKDLYIGSWFLDRFFDGIIDDIRIYDRSLSGYEIRELWRDGPIFLDGFESGDTSAWSAVVP
jgi:hypothetical protein